MSLIRWRPQGPSRRFGDEFDRMFQDLFSGWMLPPDAEGAAPLPPVNLHETDTDVVVDAELPGMDTDDVDISVHDGVLFIKGEKRSEHKEEDKDKNFYRFERRYGSFQRRVPLPCAVDADKAEAKLDKGVLHLTLPKKAEGGATKIGVKSPG